MTVSELIEELGKYPGDMHVIVNYDSGASYDPPEFELKAIDFDCQLSEYVTEYHAHEHIGLKKIVALAIS